MLITRWNEASRALPVLTLKSNYLDRWPNDRLGFSRLVNGFIASSHFGHELFGVFK